MKDPGEDQLGYSEFAKMLATSVLRGSPADGLVVGIYGEWGLGKTSLLHFIEHWLRADVDDLDAIVVRFNPWWFSGREDLLRRFLRDLESGVLRGRRKYGKIRDAVEKLGNAVAVIPNAWTTSVGKLAATAARVGQPTDVVGLKESLAQALAAEALRVVVLIDDVDRLPPADILDVFRLVKAVGDLPNVIYVLAFDRKIVTNAMAEAYGEFGAKYLDKIIQVTFELPTLQVSTIERLFTNSLDAVVAGTPAELIHGRYWSAVFSDGVLPFLRTLRDVTRLVNAIAVTYPAVRGEVNPTDFVAIETLRLFTPAAYDAIRRNPSFFVGMTAAMFASDKTGTGTTARDFHGAWLRLVPTEYQSAVCNIICALFPHAASFFGGATFRAVNDAQDRSLRRVCAEDVFEAYFRYSLGADMTRAEFLLMLERASAPLSGAATVEALAQQRIPGGTTRLRRFVDMLRDHLVVAPRLTGAPQLIQALLHVGDSRSLS